MECTAVILSANPNTQRVVPGAQTLVHVSTFRDAAGLLAARVKAIDRVQTPRFFFLDDDDDLPIGFETVLAECLSTDAALVYTDEIIRTGAGDQVRKSGPYSQAAHLEDMVLVHHLSVCDTAAARIAAAALPVGQYGFEPLFYWQLAKAGAAYLPRIGYVWNKGAGMHRTPSVAMGMHLSSKWAKENP